VTGPPISGGTGPMSTSEDQKRFRQGVEQFNTRHFFEAHETWEEIWLGSPEPEKTFLQGIIQIAAAFHHYTRGNTRGARTLLEAGLGRLEKFPATHNQLALEALRAAARTWADTLTRGHDPGPSQVPKIVYAPND
jgi:uncharacterized protein